MSANINNCWRGTPTRADSKRVREELAEGEGAEEEERRRLLREGEPVEPVILESKYIMPR